MSKQEKTKLLNKLRLYFILHPGSKEIWENGNFCRICKFNQSPVGYVAGCSNKIRVLARKDLKDVLIMNPPFEAIMMGFTDDMMFICADWIKND